MSYQDSVAAMATINRLTTHTDSCLLSEDDDHANAMADIRVLLTSVDFGTGKLEIDDYTAEILESGGETIKKLTDALEVLIAAINDDDSKEYTTTERQFISDLAMGLSLCPMHLLDYAICFDDEDPECAIIRKYFPVHDS